MKSINISLWFIFSGFITIGVLYLVMGIWVSFIDIEISPLSTIIFQLFQGLLIASGLALVFGLIYFASNSSFFKMPNNLSNFKLPIVIPILSIFTLIYYLASSFVVMFVLLMLYDGTDYTNLQNLILAITTPISYVLFVCILILILIMFSKLGKEVLSKKRIIFTAIFLIPFAIVGIFFNTYLINYQQISGLHYFFMPINIDSTNYWLVTLPYIVLFFLLGGMVLEIYFYLKKITKELIIIKDPINSSLEK